MPQHNADAFRKISFGRQEAYDQVGFTWEVKEVAWMHDDTRVDEGDDEILFGSDGRHLHDRIPSTVGDQERT